VPVTATLRTNGTLHLLRLQPSATGARPARWDTLLPDHGKLMHLFLLREPKFDTFAHLHPLRRDARNFENVLPPLPAGTYRLYAELTYEDGLNETMTTTFSLPGGAGLAPQRMVE